MTYTPMTAAEIKRYMDRVMSAFTVAVREAIQNQKLCKAILAQRKSNPLKQGSSK